MTSTPDENGVSGWDDMKIETHHGEVVKLLGMADELLG